MWRKVVPFSDSPVANFGHPGKSSNTNVLLWIFVSNQLKLCNRPLKCKMELFWGQSIWKLLDISKVLHFCGQNVRTADKVCNVGVIWHLVALPVCQIQNLQNFISQFLLLFCLDAIHSVKSRTEIEFRGLKRIN